MVTPAVLGAREGELSAVLNADVSVNVGRRVFTDTSRSEDTCGQSVAGC